MSETYPFFALLTRQRHIARWGLMRSVFPENVAEHALSVAVLSHGLALIRRELLHLPGPSPEAAAVAALFHDAPEILTGDLPTPVKYGSPALREAYAAVESQAAASLLALLPEALRASYAAVFTPPSSLQDDTAALVKAADRLAAHIKCLEELQMGNGEFRLAARQTKERLLALQRPEVDYFCAVFLPAFSLSLDELTPEESE